MTQRTRTYSKRKEAQASNAQSGRGFGEWADWLSSHNPFGHGQPFHPFGSLIWEPSQDWGSQDDYAYAWNEVNYTVLKAMLLTAARFAASALYPKKAPYPSMPENLLAGSLLKHPAFWKRVAIGMPATLAAMGYLMQPVDGDKPPPTWVVLPAGLAMMSWQIAQAFPGNKDGKDEEKDDNQAQPPPYSSLPAASVPPAVQSEDQNARDRVNRAAQLEFIERMRAQGGQGKKRKHSHNFGKLTKKCLCPKKKLKLSLRP